MADKCFTKAQADKYGLEDLSGEEQIKHLYNTLDASKLSERQAMVQAIITNKALNQVLSYTNAKGEPDYKKGLNSLLYTDRHELGKNAGLEAKMQAINAGAHAKIYKIMEEFMPRNFGLKTNRASQREFVKALMGQSKDSKFQDFATAWRDLTESLRIRFNKAGGNIAKLDDWNLPQHHDPYLVGEKGFDEWYNDIINAVDLDEMGVSLHDAPVVLKKVYDDIRTEGFASYEVGSIKGKSKVANRHRQSRFFKFKDADSWIAYQEKYTNASPYAVMMDHITMISNEIGLMENLGPNPDLGFKTIVGHVEKLTGSKEAGNHATKAYDNLAGRTSPQNRKWADRMQTLRNLEVGLKLPGAAVSALPDVMFNAMTAAYNGFSGMKLIKGFIGKLGNTAEDRRMAARLMMPLTQMLDEAHNAMRFSDVTGHGGSSRFATFVMRASGLSPWTVAGKMAFHFEFMSSLANIDIKNAKLMKAFDRYGIGVEDISVMKKSKKLVKNGVEYLDPQNLPRDVAEKVVAMVISETRYAVPEGDLLVRTVLNQGTKRGTLGGEVIRAGAMFKNFPATVIANHWMRAMKGHGLNSGGRLGYLTTMLGGTWMIGTAVVQLKELAAGREPVDWDNPELWKKGFTQAGIASIMGDIYNSDSRSYGQSFADFVGGPIASDINKIIWKGILGDLDDMKKGEKTLEEALKGKVGMAAGYVPGQFWYTKVIMERMFLDSMRRFGDPNFDLKKAQREAKRFEEFQNERW